MNKQVLDKIAFSAKVYNDLRLHTDFQEDEVLKFVEWLHKIYGMQYTKPKPTHENTPEVKQHLRTLARERN